MAQVSRLIVACATAITIVLAATGLAAAASETPVTPAEKVEFNKRMFGKEPAPTATTFACFVRKYDPDHLARHPYQKVTSMKLLYTSELFEGNTALDQHFRLGVTFRNKRGAYDSSGTCNHFRSEENGGEVRFGCGVDCDGGGINIALNKDDQTVLVRLARVRIWQNSKPDEEASESLVAGKDDAIFRLDRVSLEECRSLVTDRKELAALRAVSNRK
jgi:hypothetical protein